MGEFLVNLGLFFFWMFAGVGVFCAGVGVLIWFVDLRDEKDNIKEE